MTVFHFENGQHIPKGPICPGQRVFFENTKTVTNWSLESAILRTVEEEARRGRPEEFTEIRRMKYLELLAQGYGKVVSAHTVGVHPSTINKYTKRNPDFKESIALARAEVTDHVEGKLLEAVEDGHLKAIMFWLERQAREEWGPQSKVTVEGQVDHKHVAELAPTEALEELERRMAERQQALNPYIEGEIVDD